MPLVKLQKFISWTLLLYFAAFVIPPVSSFASSGNYGSVRIDQFTMEQDHRQTRLFLVDMLVWGQLKQSRHSDAVLLTLADARCDSPRSLSALEDALYHAAAIEENRLALSPEVRCCSIGRSLSRTSSIRFERSGISPPSLS
jgi:hypothetical protein